MKSLRRSLFLWCDERLEDPVHVALHTVYDALPVRLESVAIDAHFPCIRDAVTQVLYLGAAAGTTVSHVADIVGPSGCVYAVEFAHRPGRDLINMAKSRTNVIPVIEDARHPLKYRMLVGMVDTVFADVAQPDQVRGISVPTANRVNTATQ